MFIKKSIFGLLCLLIVSNSFAVRAVRQVQVDISSTANPSVSLGTVTFTQLSWGVLITPELNALSPGLHGFHLHANASCAQQGQGAGGAF